MTDRRRVARERVRRGQGLVEFALILPVLLLVLVGIFEFARILFIYVNVSNAAREGARYGVVHPTDLGGIRNQAVGYLTLVGDDVVPAVSYDHGPGTSGFTDVSALAAGDRVGVRMEYTIDAMTPILQPFMSDGLDFTTESWRTIEYVRSGATSTPAGAAPPGSGLWTETPTPEATATETPTPTPEFTPTNTPTPTLTPTPAPTLVPIVINPVDFEDTTVIGMAAPGRAVTLLVAQTGLQRTVTVQVDGTFTFSDLHAMLCGYTIVVSGYGQQEYATVCAGATPTPTPTQTPTPVPTATPTPETAFIYVDGGCLDPGTHTISVIGRQMTNNKYQQVQFYWDGAPVGARQSFDYKTGGFVLPVSISIADVDPESHVLSADIYDKQGNLRLGGLETTIWVCQPVPMPDLTITDLTLLDEPPLSSYQPLNALITVRNDGEIDVTSLFWVQLYGDYMTGVELDQQNVVQQYAFTGLVAGDNMSFTMVMREGFSTIGMHNLAAAVDVWSQIDESDEDNNIWASEIVSVSVPGPTPEPTPVVTPGPSGAVLGSALVETVGLQDIYVRINTYPEQATYTDPSGGYVFGSVPIGTWVITADYFDAINSVYYLGTRTVIVTEGDTSLADVFLSPFP